MDSPIFLDWLTHFYAILSPVRAFFAPALGYPAGMNTLPIPLPRTFTVFCGPHGGGEPVTQMIAELALRGPVTVLDGGNRFPAFRLLRLLRLRSPDPAATARSICIRRAFTCYQVLALLEAIPTLPHPCFLLDPLSTFYDEQVPEIEAERLLAGCLYQMERLRQSAPLLVAISPAPTSERASLVERLCSRADTLYSMELPTPRVLQPALF
jgi:hypothetical protein